MTSSKDLSDTHQSCDIWRKSIQGKGNILCKGPEAGR